MSEQKGVAFNPPPDLHIGEILASVRQAVSQLPAEKKAALVTVATEKGVNAAIAVKLSHGWVTTAWIGKSWGAPVGAGATISKSW